MPVIQTIDIGSGVQTGDGDTLRDAFDKLNQNNTSLNDGIAALAGDVITLAEFKAVVAASTDFANFKSRVAAL